MFFWAILFITGQAFAQVTVYVDVKQTGPTSVGGEVQARVGKNVDSTYSAEARYNGQPTLNHEETIQNTKWTYTVSADNKITYNPKSGNGNTVTITAKSAEVGTYEITATFKVTFTIKKPNTQPRYVNYTGDASATLNIKDGKFEVKIKPDDNFPQFTGDTNGYRNKLGIGEEATILVFPKEGSTDTVTFSRAEPDDAPFGTVGGDTIVAKDFASSGTLEVWAKDANGVEIGPETIGITIVEPGGATIKKTLLTNLRHDTKGKPSAGFLGMVLVHPQDVSFYRISVREWGTKENGTSESVATGPFDTIAGWNKLIHNPGNWLTPFQCENSLLDPRYKEANVACEDKVHSGEINALPPLDEEGLFTWVLPWQYKIESSEPKKLHEFIHKAKVEKDGKMTISKGGESFTIPADADPSTY